MSGVEGGKGIRYQWKEKGQCSKGDKCSFLHESNDRAQKPRTPKLPHLLSHQCHEVEVCRGKEVSEANKSNHCAILRKPCRYYLPGTCTRSSCEYWHPPECYYQTETGCKAGDKYLFPHQKVDEQPNEKPKKSYFPKRRESDDRGAVALVNIVPQMGCVSQDSGSTGFSKRRTVPVKPDAQTSWDRFEKVRFTQSTLRQASIRDNKGPSLGKIQVKLPHRRSPYAMKFEDRSQEETERQRRCAQSKARNLFKNTKSSKK